jgi:hypothetical protein
MIRQRFGQQRDSNRRISLDRQVARKAADRIVLVEWIDAHLNHFTLLLRLFDTRIPGYITVNHKDNISFVKERIRGEPRMHRMIGWKTHIARIENNCGNCKAFCKIDQVFDGFRVTSGVSGNHLKDFVRRRSWLQRLQWIADLDIYGLPYGGVREKRW